MRVFISFLLLLITSNIYASDSYYLVKPKGNYSKNEPTTTILYRISKLATNKYNRPYMERKYITNTILQLSYTVWCMNQNRGIDMDKIATDIMYKAQNIEVLPLLREYSECWVSDKQTTSIILDRNDDSFLRAIKASLKAYNKKDFTDYVFRDDNVGKCEIHTCGSETDEGLEVLLERLRAIAREKGFKVIDF